MRTINDEQHALVHCAFFGGESISSIAMRHGVPLRTVEDWLRKTPRYRFSRACNGAWLRRLRQQAGLRLVDVSERLGYGKSYLAAIETNKRPCPLHVELFYERGFSNEEAMSA